MNSEYPKGWKKTLHELLREGLQHSPQEIEWARAFEREQLRKWVRFPQGGDIYESLHDVEIFCMTHWQAPFTGGDRAVLPGGTRVLVEEPFAREPVSVYTKPIDYERLESILVPQADRTNEKYDGYSIVVETAQLNRDFNLIFGQSEES